MSRAILNSTGGGYNSDDYTATPQEVLTGYIAGCKGYDDPVEGVIPLKESENYIPGVSNIVLPAGQYLQGDQIVFGDPGLIPENIKKGQMIFGVVGTHDGWVPGPKEIYNRGTFGDGFDNGFFKKAQFSSSTDSINYTITNEDTNIQLYRAESSSTAGIVSTRTINFSSYNSINIRFSFSKEASNGYTRAGLYVCQGLTNYLLPPNSIANGKLEYISAGTEYVISANIANINLMCGFTFYCLNTGVPCSTNIYQIWFT